MTTCWRTSDERVPRLWPWLILCAVLAVWIDLGTLHRHHNGDSIIPILVSLYRWTPFFWSQDRIGMLIPLLATPFDHPLANLLVQDGILIFCTLASFYLLARYLVGDWCYPWVATFALFTFLVLVPEKYCFHFMVTLQMGLWLFLGLAGIILCQRHGRWLIARRLAALACFMLAHWVYLATVLILAPLAALHGLANWLQTPTPTPNRKGDRWLHRLIRLTLSDPVVTLALLSLGLTAGIYFMRRSANKGTTHLGSLPPDQWLPAAGQLLENTWSSLSPPYWLAIVLPMVIIGILLTFRRETRAVSVSAWLASAAGLLSGIAFVLVMSTRKWVEVNNYCDRYIMPAVFLCLMAVCSVGLVPALRWLGASRCQRLSRALPLLAGLAAGLGYGFPSLAGVHRDLDATIGQYTADLLDSRCTHLAGNYWQVWPGIFHANLRLYERGESRAIWGLAFRGWPMRECWKDMPIHDIRVAGPPNDPEVVDWIGHLGLPTMVPVQLHGQLVIWEAEDNDN